MTDSDSIDRPMLWDISQIRCDGAWYLKPEGYVGPFTYQYSYLNDSYEVAKSETS
jgi:hypothetical protein